MTVGYPIAMAPPCTVGSPIRAAIMFPMKTVGDPIAMLSGGPTQVHKSVARAAGWPPISTVGHPGGKIGPPTCGTTPVTIGHVCISPTLAAWGILITDKNSSVYGRADFWPDLESSAQAGSVGFASLGVSGLSGLLPPPEPAEPPLLIITIVP